MWLYCLLVVFLSSSHFVYPREYDDTAVEEDSDSDSDSMDNFKPGASDEDVMPGVSRTDRQPLPPSVRISASMLYKELFTPAKGSGPVPPLVKKILLPEPVASTKFNFEFTGPKVVEVMCFLDRMHVRVLRSFFTNPKARKILKLGTCSVNKLTKTHFHLMYFLKECGIQKEEDADRVLYSNTLIYQPDTGMIVRELPFTVDIRCSYAKFHRSYTVGFLPQIAGGTLFKGLTQNAPTLAAMDESWTLLPADQSFVLGKPVCFEAKGASSSPGKRLYLNSCFVTSSQSPMSEDKYSLVENYGCLVDSKNSPLTKFYTSPNKMTVRLCVAAFLFKNMISWPLSKKTMYLHCELGFGPETPTLGAKSCTYNAQTMRWTELYGDPSVCNCCASKCPASPRESGKEMLTSESWDLTIGKETSPDKRRPEFPVVDRESGKTITGESWDSTIGKETPFSPDKRLPMFPVDDRDFELFWESDDR